MVCFLSGLLLGFMLLRFIHAATGVSGSVCFIADYTFACICIHTYHNLFNLAFVDIFSSLMLLWIKLLWTFSKSLFVNICFRHMLCEHKCLDSLSCGRCMFSFEKSPKWLVALFIFQSAMLMNLVALHTYFSFWNNFRLTKKLQKHCRVLFHISPNLLQW